MVAMSKDKVLPSFIQKIHPKTGSYFIALSIFAALTMFIVFIGKGVDNILGFTMFLDSLGMCTAAFTLFVLRKKKIGNQYINGDNKWYVPVLASFFVTLYALVAIAVFFKSPISALIGVILLSIFLAIYFVDKMKLN